MIALGLGTAFAAGPIAVTSVNVGAGGTDVVVPPVAVTDIDYDIEWENGKGFMVRVVTLTLESTDAGTHDVDIYVALTKDGDLLAPDLAQRVAVGQVRLVIRSPSISMERTSRPRT